jgi:hypothetical protein
VNGLCRRIRKRVAATYQRTVDFIPNPRLDDEAILLRNIASRGIPGALQFHKSKVAYAVLSFVSSLNVGAHHYRYSPSVTLPTVYSSVYACLLLSLFGEIETLSNSQRRSWASFFNFFQSRTDGLFRDPAVYNKTYEHADWWGARHFALHIVAAYRALDHVPGHSFFFLEPYTDTKRIRKWLDRHVWESSPVHANDIDNQIMNIACLLQFERDFRSNKKAGMAVQAIKDYLREKQNPETGLWGNLPTEDPAAVSRAVQFAYHLYPIFFYDDEKLPYPEKAIDLTLATQNDFGGYGVNYNSSACEDIDSILLLSRLSQSVQYRKDEIELSLKRALVWMLSNQNDDGGFVFRRNLDFTYGHPLMSSKKNESAMFPTWFRVLAIAYATTHLNLASFSFARCPGYQFI